MALSKVINIFKRLNKRSSEKYVVPAPEAVWQKPLYFLGFGFGSGAIPFAPGTFGTLFAIPLYLCVQYLPLWAYISVTLGLIILSTWICSKLSAEMHCHDHPGMCIDEFAGFFVTMINAPHGAPWVLLGFLLFRLFDIWKPWPINAIDNKVHGGFGMVLDDVVAGLFACLIIQLIIRLLL